MKVGGEAVELTAKEFDLLTYFLESPGVVHSRDRLLDRVWGMSYPGGTRTVDVHVGQLRRKLGRPDADQDRPRGRVQGRRAVSARRFAPLRRRLFFAIRRHRRPLHRRDVRGRRRAFPPGCRAGEHRRPRPPGRPHRRAGEPVGRVAPVLAARAASAVPGEAEPADRDRRPRRAAPCTSRARTSSRFGRAGPWRARITVDGEAYLFAARNVQGKGFVLLRPKDPLRRLAAVLLALLIAGRSPLCSPRSVRSCTAPGDRPPVRRVAEASQSLAAGRVARSRSRSRAPTELGAARDLVQRDGGAAADGEGGRAQLPALGEPRAEDAADRDPRLRARGSRTARSRAEEAAATIREEARRLERLVRDLLDLARMNRREFAIHREQIDLARRRSRGSPALRGGGARRRRRARRDRAGRGAGDRATRTASSRSSPTSSRTRSARRLPAARCTFAREPGVIEVVDTGVGLAPEDVPHAFERFYLHDRAAASRTERAGAPASGSRS